MQDADQKLKDDADMASLKRHRSLIMSMALLATVTLLGFLGLLGAILYKISAGGESAQILNAQTMGTQLILPQGAKLLSASFRDDHIQALIIHPDLGEDQPVLLIFDAKTGTELRRFTLRPSDKT